MVRREKLEELKSYIEELKIIKMETLDTSKQKEILDSPSFLSFTKHRYYLNNGKEMTRELLHKQGGNGNAALVLPITEDGNCILTVEPRLGATRTVAVGLPAGYVERREEALKAAIRELQEETGYVCRNYYLLAKYYQDPGISQAYNYAYLGTEAKKVGKQKLDSEEFIRYFECTYKEALELVDLGYIEDVQAQLALEKAKQYILK